MDATFLPFDNIALTFSGGGFRAAAFSLGALSYLKEIGMEDSASPDTKKGLLGNIAYISSTSGGSFTNALYTQYIHEDLSFDSCYAKLVGAMDGQLVLDEVFRLMKDDRQWGAPGAGKQRNFINAFAKAYDSLIFEGRTAGVFWSKEHVAHFEVCFNATEFYRGLSFRFQTAGNDNHQQVIGNKYLFFNTGHLETFKKIKLADMVAASSCFPGGFEPIIFPQDFSYDDACGRLDTAVLKAALMEETYQEEVRPASRPYGFMDGGITDNQALNSAMLADERRRATPMEGRSPFDLIMVTDVTSYFMEEYDLPGTDSSPSWKQEYLGSYLEQARKIFRKVAGNASWPPLVFSLLFTASAAVVFAVDSVPLKIFAGFTAGISAVLLALLYFVGKTGIVKWIAGNNGKIMTDAALTDMMNKKKSVSVQMLTGLLNFLKGTRVAVLEQMVKARIASMLSLVLDINLKHTRRLIYDKFYKDGKWDNRRVANFIYELSTYNVESRIKRISDPVRLHWHATAEDKKLLLDGFEKINPVAEEARNMGTTLWFDDKDKSGRMLRKIIAAGQFTTCCNLLEYVISLERNQVALEEDAMDSLMAMKTRLVADLAIFKADPFYLYDVFDKKVAALPGRNDHLRTV